MQFQNAWRKISRHMIGLDYLAVSSAIGRRDFRCSACGFISPVHVQARAGGYAVSRGSFRPSQAARRRARTQAETGAARMADVYVQLCPCPACGRRDPASVTYFRRRGRLVLALGTGALALGGALLPTALWIVGITVMLLGLVMAISGPLMVRFALRNAARQVRFDVPPPPTGTP